MSVKREDREKVFDPRLESGQQTEARFSLGEALFISKETADDGVTTKESIRREEDLTRISKMFVYHHPSAAAKWDMEHLRNLGHTLSRYIYEAVPNPADKWTAIRKVLEAIMTANHSIAAGE